MDLDTWVRALVEDCSRREDRFRLLNAMYATGWSVEGAKRRAQEPDDPDDDWAPPKQPRQYLEWAWGALNGDVPKPPIYLPQSCGGLANWLCELMLGRFDVDFGARMAADSVNHTRSYDVIKQRIRGRDTTLHHIVRIDSGPLGHNYILYLPPANDAVSYYHYQNNCNVALPFLTLNGWIASGRSVAHDSIFEHVENLRALDTGIPFSMREWILRKFSVHDPRSIRFMAGGHYEYTEASDEFPEGAGANYRPRTRNRTLKLGQYPENQRGHQFTFARVVPATFKASLLSLYTYACLNSYVHTRFDDL